MSHKSSGTRMNLHQSDENAKICRKKGSEQTYKLMGEAYGDSMGASETFSQYFIDDVTHELLVAEE